MGLLFRKKKREVVQRQETAERGAEKGLLSCQIAGLQGIGARERQEDSFVCVNASDVTLIREKGLLAVVADGMGGMQDGKIASETAVNCFQSDFNRLDYDADLAAQLRDSVLHANQEVYQILKGEGGSTAVLCLLYREKLFYAGVGDSFLYLKREGELCRVNREHNILHQKLLQAIREGNMEKSEAEGDPEKAALTQFLGMDELTDTDSLRRPLALQGGDVLLLCTDGVGGVLTEECISDCLKLADAGQICAELERNILRENRRNQDNYTILVIRCEY